MYPLLILAISSFCVAFVLTPLCRSLAIRWGLVDHPDNIRKFHMGAIPRIGGFSIFIAYSFSFALLFYSPFHALSIAQGDLEVVLNLFPAATLVFITGILDDLLGLKAWQKFTGQLAAAGVAIWSGVQIDGIVGQHLPSWCSIPVTVLWLVGCTNAFNLIDGVDGLAAGVGLFATMTTLIAALIGHNYGLAVATVPLAGALLGILRYNFNPASIFLGDSGSLLIGFLLGCYSVIWSHKAVTFFGMTAPLIALSIPLLDTGLAVIRRFLRNQPIFGADRSHIHHKLLARGFTPRRVVFLMYIICGLCAVLSLLQNFAHERFGGAIIAFICVAVWIGVRHLGYAEFDMARRIVLTGNFRRRLNAELQLSKVHNELIAARTSDQCWEVLRHNYSEFGFNEIRFKFGDHLYRHTTNGHHIANTWTVRIQLSENDYINLSREFDTQSPPIVARFTDTIGTILLPKTFEMLRMGPNPPNIAIVDGREQSNGDVKKPLDPISVL